MPSSCLPLLLGFSIVSFRLIGFEGAAMGPSGSCWLIWICLISIWIGFVAASFPPRRCVSVWVCECVEMSIVSSFSRWFKVLLNQLNGIISYLSSIGLDWSSLFFLQRAGLLQSGSLRSLFSNDSLIIGLYGTDCAGDVDGAQSLVSRQHRSVDRAPSDALYRPRSTGLNPLATGPRSASTGHRQTPSATVSHRQPPSAIVRPRSASVGHRRATVSHAQPASATGSAPIGSHWRWSWKWSPYPPIEIGQFKLNKTVTHIVIVYFDSDPIIGWLRLPSSSVRHNNIVSHKV